MKKELLENIIKLKRISRTLGFKVEEISIDYYYFENLMEIPPKKIFGVNIKGGEFTNDIIIRGKKIG